jgi:ribosomal-protein-alanine N-acetyltransferase
MSISLVRMTPENVELYLERIHEIEILSFPSPWSINAFRQEVKNSVSHLLGLFVNGALEGYICFWLFDGEIQLVNIAVHPKARGCGLGHCLLAKMLEFAASRGTQRVWLEVRQSNRTARRLYENFGFMEAGRRRKYYTDNNEDAVVMSLILAEKSPESESRKGKSAVTWTTSAPSSMNPRHSF